MYTIKIDESRAMDAVEKFRQRANTAENFINQKMGILTDAKPSIETFMQAVNGTELVMGNMYSTGSDSNETYSGDCRLLVHGVLTLKKEYINKKLLAKKLSDMWRSSGPSTISAYFEDYTIKGCEVKFTIYVK